MADDPELVSLQARVAQLTKQRNEAYADLLNIRATKKLNAIISPDIHSSLSSNALDSYNDSTDDELSSLLLGRSATIAAENDAWNLEALYRMSGITTFAVADPSDGDKRLVGVRIEVYVDGRFQKPHYLFLAPYKQSTTQKDGTVTHTDIKTHFTVYRHTLPAYFIPKLDKWITQYLPPPPRKQNLDPFVAEVRQVVMLHAKRQFLLEKAKKECLVSSNDQDSRGQERNGEIVVSRFEIDTECLQVSISWREYGVDEEDGRGSRQAMFTLDDEGMMTAIIVKMHGKRIRRMEEKLSTRKRLVQSDRCDDMQDLEHLAENLKWIT